MIDIHTIYSSAISLVGYFCNDSEFDHLIFLLVLANFVATINILIKAELYEL